jgi:hypothetical protein
MRIYLVRRDFLMQEVLLKTSITSDGLNKHSYHRNEVEFLLTITN